MFFSLPGHSQSVLTYRNCYDFLVNGVIESKKTTINNHDNLPPSPQWDLTTEVFFDSIISKQILANGDSVKYEIFKKKITSFIQDGQTIPQVSFSNFNYSIKYPFMEVPVQKKSFEEFVFTDSIIYQNGVEFSGQLQGIPSSIKQLFYSNFGGPYNSYNYQSIGSTSISYIPTRFKGPNQTLFESIVLGTLVHVPKDISGLSCVFPNPTSIQPLVLSPEMKGATIYISDIQGRKKEISLFWDGSPISIEDWSPGVYFLQIYKEKLAWRPIKIIKGR